MRIRDLSSGVFEIINRDKKILATLNLIPGRKVYGENLIPVDGKEYRSWNPTRSKLGAAIIKGLGEIPISRGSKVLYLGVASGTTCSHISDIVGHEGHVWGVDFAPRPFLDFLNNLVRYRENISPIFGDARLPELYSSLVSRVEMVYSDVAQPGQADILAKNAKLYLKNKGWAMVAIKSRSIDSSQSPEEVYNQQGRELRKHGFKILEVLNLEPFEKDHAMILTRYNG